ncbi:MAG: hypothetical protein MRY78_13385 [Saprospiraceae bacterium]|nr:hypothetical protein [Saprospiraceae bacterium]
MLITDDKTIGEIKREFHQLFSHLKLEFYASQHAVGEGSPAKAQIQEDVQLKEVRNKHEQQELTIQPEMKVKELESAFEDLLGLHVQVFRKSGNLWMQTTATDEWTLAEQNRKGGSSELHYEEKYKG